MSVETGRSGEGRIVETRYISYMSGAVADSTDRSTTEEKMMEKKYVPYAHRGGNVL